MTQQVKLVDIAPGRTDRALIIGATGSGKSTVARTMAALRSYVVVHDGKGLVNWPGYKLCHSLREVERCKDPQKYPRITYRPNRHEKHDDGAKQAFFEWIYSRGNTTLIVDEVFQIVQGNSLPEGYLACLTSGREHGIEVWNCCQRPTRIPPEILGEAEHVYVFRLRLEQDRRKVADVTGLDQRQIVRLPKQLFYYVPEDGEPVGPMRINLGSQGATSTLALDNGSK
jgi:energy-coupling factor transporter ATP-binding protein EcfA2